MEARTLFGTDGIRGEANTYPLEPESLVRIGKAIAELFKNHGRRHRILIGKDTRLSGYMIETALASGITSKGVDVMLTGPIPTPGVAYLTKSMRADAGIVVSASHNPYKDNGVKIFDSNGLKLSDQDEERIEKYYNDNAIMQDLAIPPDVGKAYRIDDATGRYTVFLKSAFPQDLNLNGLKIGLDCAHGATYMVAPQVFFELGADVVAKGVNPNGININAGVGSLYPEAAKDIVLSNNLDICFSYDGDGDRVVVVDKKGSIINGDAILGIGALYLLEKGSLNPPIVVGTEMTNMGLEKFLRERGIQLVRTKVGDRYVAEEMMAKGALIGGEQSGHIILRDKAMMGDGILTSLFVLEVMLRGNTDLSEMVSQIPFYPQVIVSVNVRHKPPLETLEGLKKTVWSIQQKLKQEGRVSVRYSGTEPKARVMVECSDERLCEEYANEIAHALQEEIG